MTQRNLNPNNPFFHEERYASLAPFADKLITICGAGTLGGNLVETLARMGFTHLKLIDKDRVETRNLSTQPYSRAEVGAPKARTLANMLYRTVQAKIEPAVIELTSANSEDLLRGSALVVDAFDNRAARAAVNETAHALQLPCLHIGFSPDGLYGSGLWEPHYEVPRDTPGDPCDYPLTRPLALVLTALAARSICDRFSKGQSNNFELTWNDLKIEYV
jgi:molybdopterin-synthase adenylyltransferase